MPKDAQCSEMDFSVYLTILRILVFETWSILYSTFVVNWGIRWIQNKCYVTVAPPPKPTGSWGLGSHTSYPACFFILNPFYIEYYYPFLYWNIILNVVRRNAQKCHIFRENTFNFAREKIWKLKFSLVPQCLKYIYFNMFKYVARLTH